MTPVDPEKPAVLTALADHQAGRLDDADRGYRAVLARSPRHPAALHLAGAVALQQGRHAEAIGLIAAAVTVDPRQPDFHVNLGSAFQGLGRFAAAEHEFAAAIGLDPRLPEAHFNRALALQRLGRPEEAEASARQAVALRPRYAQALTALASLLAVRRRYDEAAAVAQAALAADPRHVPAYTAMADVCRRMGDVPAARAWCERALAVNPAAAEAHATLAVLLLLDGDFANGWREYEYRFAAGDQAAARQRFSQPRWDGSPLAGRTVLLWVEQGLGDAIQFVRFAPLVAGGRVVVDCPPTLVDLFRTAAGVQAVVATGDPLPAVDVHCPLGSLPHVLGTAGQTLAASVPYLSADPARVAAWADRLGPPDGRPRVGLVWAGSPSHLNDRNRSMTPADLSPLLAVPGVRFVSLQLGRPSPAGAADVTPALSELAQTAAALANLDLLVTVDSAVAHLAGATGVPAWVLLPFAPDWRWRLAGAESQWYPALRLFRQSQAGDWSGPVAAAASELARWSTRPSAPAGGTPRAPSQPS